MSAEIKVHPGKEDVAGAATDVFIRLAEENLAARGRFVVALAGGSTPGRTYELLAERAKDSVDWSRVVITWGDDRCVAPDHEHSNYANAKRALLNHVAVSSDNILRVEGDDGDHHAAADRFETKLKSILGNEPIDLVLLGMGGDGHTASLFPGDDAGGASRLAVPIEAPETSPIKNRVSLSYEAIAAARRVIALVTGEGKAERLKEVLSGESDLPLARVVRDRSGNVIFMVDEAAASKRE